MGPAVLFGPAVAADQNGMSSKPASWGAGDSGSREGVLEMTAAPASAKLGRAMRSSSRSFGVIVAATVSLVVLAAPHVAAAEGDGRWPTRTILYHNGAAKYASSVKQAARLWNRSGVKVRFKAVSKREARLRVVISDRGLFGGLGFTELTGRRGTIRLASAIRKASSAPELSGLLTARVVAHEFGHVLGLRHDSGRCTVMYVHTDETLPPGCPSPKRGWRYRCRVLEVVDVRRAVKIWGGRVRSRPRRV